MDWKQNPDNPNNVLASHPTEARVWCSYCPAVPHVPERELLDMIMGLGLRTGTPETAVMWNPKEVTGTMLVLRGDHREALSKIGFDLPALQAYWRACPDAQKLVPPSWNWGVSRHDA